MSAKLIKENRVTAMRRELLDELMTVSEEESKYRAGQNLIERQLYSGESIDEIDREKLLKRGRLIPSSQPFCGFSGAQAQLRGNNVCGTGKNHACDRGQGACDAKR